MTKSNPFRYFKTSPEIIRLAVMLYIRFPLSLILELSACLGAGAPAALRLPQSGGARYAIQPSHQRGTRALFGWRSGGAEWLL
jgi:hypothetical protein